jgi:release factor glutamine methyltransferase
VEADAAVVARLRAAGCVWAEDEASLLASAASSSAELDAMVERRAAGEPVEQVVGWAEFRGLRIFVDPGVFVPRRRSEYLVAVAARMATERGNGVPPLIADLCCGTGALGLAVAAETAGTWPAGRTGSPGIVPGRTGSPGTGSAGTRPNGAGPAGTGSHSAGSAGTGSHSARSAGSGSHSAGSAGTGSVRLHAADLDPAAVACARRNVEPTGGRVYQGDLFAALPDSLRGLVDVLVCNAPYVPTADIAFMPAEAREHEAPMALDGGDDGLDVLRRAVTGASSWLAPGGVLLVETSERQALLMTAAMSAAGLAPAVHEDDESGATVITGVR